MSDNAYNFHRHEGYQVVASGETSPGEPGEGWFDFENIHRCNEFLANVENVEFTDESLKNLYKSEVRFLRAYSYFVRTMHYGDFPLFTENFVTPEEAKVSRNSKDEVESFIISELKDIIPLLPEKEHITEDGRVGKAAAQALLMRFYLFKGMYTEALETAKSITGYSLFQEGYEKLFLIENQINDETILSIQAVKTLHNMDFTPHLPNSAGGWSSVVPTQQLVDAYEISEGLTIEEAKAQGKYDPANPYLNRDPRLRATIIYPGQNWNGKIYNSVLEGNDDYPTKANNATKTGYNFKKYFNNLEQYGGEYWDTGKNIILFRYAEVLLTIAEAKIELNLIDEELYNAIDQVRTRAGMPKVDRLKYSNQQSLRDLVRRERRVEFAYEGMRRYDIIRWDIAKDVLNVRLVGCNQGTITDEVGDPVTGDVNVKLDGEPFYVEMRTFTDKNLLLPIPIEDLDSNPALKQNPGY